MLYERYELKMQRLAAVKRNVLKLKIPFIILLSLLSLAVVVLLSLSGLITTDLESVSDVTYGQSLSLQAEVMFGDADFEFRQINTRSSSEWTTVEPILPGTYEVRVTSSRTIGTSKGDSFEFSIFPKESTIKVKDSILTFGNDFSFTADLVSGDYIVSGDVLYEEDNYYILTTQNVLPNIESIVVYNKDGFDVSTAYDFTAIESSIKFNQRIVTFTADNATKVYDGTELTCNTYNVSNLIDGHKYNLDVNGSITNYGTSNNVISNVEINVDNKDITHMYNVITSNGTLSISKKDLYVTTSSATKVYDGTILSNNDFTHTGLVSGDSISLLTTYSKTYFGNEDNKLVVTTSCNENYNIIYTYGKLSITAKNITVTTATSSSIYDGDNYYNEEVDIIGLVGSDSYKITSNTSIKLVGNIQNNLVVAIYNGTTNISDCYNISYTYGTLTITKRDIVITSNSATKVYDGTALEQTNHTTSNLASSDTTTVVSNSQLITVGSIDNVISVKITNSGIDVTSCYNIDYVTNKLVVTSLEIFVQTNDNTKVYDGTALTDSTWVYVSGSATLVSNHNLVITTTGTITSVGSTKNTYSSFKVYSNGVDVTDNYIVNISEGDLSITKRNVTITTSSAEKVYDDTQLVSDSFTITSGDLVLDHKIDLTITGSVTTVGNTSNVCTTPIVLSGLIDVTNNYDVTVIHGILTINSRVIDVITNSATKVYNGEELVEHSWVYNNSTYEILSTHFDVVVYSGSIISVGETNNTISSFKIFKNSEDVTSNYTVNIAEGTLSITKRSISVTTDGDTKVYDGVALTVNSWTYNNSLYKLLADHNLNIIYTGSQINVGESSNTYSSFSVVFGLTDVTDNYDISISLGSLVVTSLNVTVKTNSNRYVYNGLVQFDEIYTVKLADNQTSSIDVITGELDVILNGLNKYTIKIFDASNYDVTNNYSITYDYGRLEIYKREVTIITNNDFKVYDGTELTNNTWSYDLSANKFVDSHNFNIVITGSITEVEDENTVGKSNNTYSSYSLVDASNTDVLSNYQLTVNLGTLTIEHRVVAITTASGSKIFDDTELSVSGYTMNSDTPNQIVDGQVLTVCAFASVTLVEEGVVLNDYDYYYVMSNNIDVTKNYNFDISLGKIFIVHRTVLITTASISGVYDGNELYIHEWVYTDRNEYEILENIHTFDVTYLKSLTNYGRIENEITFEIFRTIDNYDLNQNYNIIVSNGEIEVVKREVNIISASDSKIYDGTELSNNTWYYIVGNEYEFVDDVEVFIYSSIINFGEIENEITSVLVDNGEKNDNYIINTFTGKLSISKRDIIITTSDDDKTYDGYSLSNDSVVIESNNGDRGIALTDTYIVNGCTQITYVSIIINEVDLTIYNDGLSYENFDPNDNYDIEFIYGYLEITRREITIKTESLKDVYNGTYISNTDFVVSVGTLALTDELWLIDYTKLWLVSDGEIENVLTFEIYHINDNVDLSYNYTISFDNGKLEMLQYQITLITGSDEQVYDGTLLSSKNFFDEFDNEIELLGDDLFDYISYTQVRYFTDGTINNEIEFKVYNGELDVTDNYIFDYSCGTLEIFVREVVIQTGSKTFEYTGQPQNYEYYEYLSFYEFIQTDGIVVTFLNSVTYVTDGDVDNIVSISFINTLAKSSYNIVVEEPFGIINISEIVVTIKTESDEKMYDGFPLTKITDFVVSGLDDFDGYDYHIDIIGSITNPGTIYNNIDEDGFTILDEFDNDVTKNFIINYDYGTLTVYELNLEIYSVGGSFEYDGYDLTYGHIIIIQDGSMIFNQNDLPYNEYYAFELGSTDTIYINVNGIVNANDLYNETKNTFDYYVLRDGEDVTGNYTFDKIENKMQIIQRDITITSQSQEFDYDGEEHYWHYYDITEGSLVLDHYIDDTYTGVIIDLGVETNWFDISIFSLSTDMSDFYNIILVEGNLIMSAGEIYFETLSNIDDVFMFNGEYHSYLEFIIKDEDGNDITEFYMSKFSFEIDLDSITTIRNVSDNGIENVFIIRIYSGTLEVTNSFEPIYTYGSLYIEALSIDVSATDNYVSYEYNGYSQTINVSDVYIAQNIYDEFYVVSGTGLVDPSYAVLVFTISFGEFDSNYNICYSEIEAIIEITKITIVVRAEEYLAEYNGEIQYASTYSIAGTFALNHIDLFSFITTSTKEINYVDDKFIDDKSNYLITFSDFVIYGVDTDTYYDITFDYTYKAYMMITKINVSIETMGYSKTYDGTELTRPTAILEGNILPGHNIDVLITTSIINVGEIDNDYETILFSDSNSILSDEEVKYIYNICCETIGVLEITVRDLEIITYSYSREYAQEANYRTEHTNYTRYVIPVDDPRNALISWQVLTLNAVELSVNRVGTIELIDFLIMDGLVDVTSNYNIINEIASIKYTQVEVVITSASASKGFDGEALFDWSTTITDGYLLDGHSYECVITATRTSIGQSTNRIISYTIFDEYNNELSDEDIELYYNITTVNGTLTIT